MQTNQSARILVLDSSGHMTLEWNPDDADEVARTRREVERLKGLGYRFFVADRSPADEVTAGGGKLLAEFVDDPMEALVLGSAEVVEQPDSAQPSRSRTRRQRDIVAVQPMRGG